MKKYMYLAAAALMSAAMTIPVFAKNEIARDSTGNGITIYYDDGSVFEYNARGSSATYYDPDGTEHTYDDVQLTESDFNKYTNSTSNRSSSGKSSSKSSSKYEDSEVTDAYWDYSNGKCTAKWDADNRSKGKYTVTLYRDGKKVTSKTSNGGSSINFTNAIADHNKTGNYYFSVKGKWTGGVTDTEDSDDLYVDSGRLRTIRNKSGNSSDNRSSGSKSSSTSSSVSAANPSAGPSSTTTGWQWINGVWKYRRTNGIYAANCWELVNGKWYCFDENGIMKANQWVRNTTNEHIWYYVGSDGAMVTNTVIDGWTVNANGECWY